MLASAAATWKESGMAQNQGKQWSSPPAMTIDPSKTYTATIKTSLGKQPSTVPTGREI